MSGICGILRLDGGSVDRVHLEQMMNSMPHRCLDGMGYYVNGKVGLSNGSVNTTPQSEYISLPLSSSDKQLHVIMDGRVDNWEALRRTLLERKTRLRNHSDAELVLQAYRIWGENCFQYINGDFAIVIWDEKNSQLICGRDRSAKKPFYYHTDANSLSFASEMSALLSLPWISGDINEPYLIERLCDTHRSLRETCWRNIYRLPQAHYMVIGPRGVQQNRYWFPEKLPPLLYKSQDEYVDHYKDILADTVRRYSRSNKELSFEVSGGVDSSSLFSVAAELEKDSKLLAPSMQGYTLDFHGDNEANELLYAKAVSDKQNKSIKKIAPAYSTLEAYDSFAKKYKTFPVGPNGYMHHNIYKHLKSMNKSVLITGSGGDEWLSGGINGYAGFLKIGDWAGFTETTVSDISSLGLLKTFYKMGRYGGLPILPDPIKAILNKLRSQARRELNTRHLPITPHVKNHLLTRQNLITAELSDIPAKLKKLGLLFNPEIRHANETMEHLAALEGVELRSPFDSKDIIEFSFVVSDGRKRQTSLNRDLHREAMKGTLPDLVRLRNNKAIFCLTYDHYIENLITAKDWQSRIINRGWADPTTLKHLCERLKNPQNHSDRYIIWPMFSASTLLVS